MLFVPCLLRPPPPRDRIYQGAIERPSRRPSTSITPATQLTKARAKLLPWVSGARCDYVRAQEMVQLGTPSPTQNKLELASFLGALFDFGARRTTGALPPPTNSRPAPPPSNLVLGGPAVPGVHMSNFPKDVSTNELQ